MIKKIWKKLRWIIIGAMVSYVVYLTVVILAAFAIPFPTNEQLKEAEKVVKQYIYKNQGVELLNISSGPTAEMFDHTIHVSGDAKGNPNQKFRVNLDQVKSTTEKVTRKSIHEICIGNGGEDTYQCEKVKIEE
ncbi:hypothetical protein P4G85_06170 [Bacillus cereus]|uniref:Uncharacterized protein n=2 Tax=Bacillus cereus group TaxID=86661 RepID=A0A9W5KQJ3_BACCE|nr:MULTISPECIES: hypothetical protein [Bacillus cereus group]MEB8732204.1 hypothetical protein [Bacillus cereus]EEM44715.1 hypothetical protein bthur0005_54650 [Bacillus thuringiensis serovar pakistani str. T13001]EJR59622.1 hypothetical protein IK5_06259 [Bacillus cereus VD154]EJR60478.1 hypothetical protein IK5_06194 [Bacillus cereus VD154]KIU73290.1 group-specific protein [Bacillus thuringiensis Sbt003]